MNLDGSAGTLQHVQPSLTLWRSHHGSISPTWSETWVDLRGPSCISWSADGPETGEYACIPEEWLKPAWCHKSWTCVTKAAQGKYSPLQGYMAFLDALHVEANGRDGAMAISAWTNRDDGAHGRAELLSRHAAACAT